jgi:hypothetical protein
VHTNVQTLALRLGTHPHAHRGVYVPRPPGVTTRSLDIVSQMMMEVIRWNASWARGWGPSVSLRVRDSKETASTSVATSANHQQRR